METSKKYTIFLGYSNVGRIFAIELNMECHRDDEEEEYISITSEMKKMTPYVMTKGYMIQSKRDMILYDYSYEEIKEYAKRYNVDIHNTNCRSKIYQYALQDENLKFEEMIKNRTFGKVLKINDADEIVEVCFEDSNAYFAPSNLTHKFIDETSYELISLIFENYNGRRIPKMYVKMIYDIISKYENNDVEKEIRDKIERLVDNGDLLC